MKRSIFYLLTTLMLCLATGCRHTASYPLAMQQAESLMNARPDSALQLLQAMEDTVSILPEEARMYWHLLTVQAKDKLYITHTDDSLIYTIVQYYEASDDKDRLMMAYFYQGATYRDMNDAPRALKAYHQAIDAGEGTKNLTLMGQTYGQMGTLLTYQKIYDEAMESKKKALHYYKLADDSVRYPYLIRDIARIYSAQEENDSALHYYQEAYRLALPGNKRLLKYNIASEIGCLHYDMGDFHAAKDTLLKVVSDGHRMSNALLKLGFVYEKEGQADSARIFWEEAKNSTDLYIQSTAYLCLSRMLEGKSTKADYYMIQHNLLKDSLHAIMQTEAIGKYHLLYKFQRSEKQNDALKLESQHQQTRIYLLLLVLTVILFLSVLIIFHYRKERMEALTQAQRFRILQEEIQKSMKETETQMEKFRAMAFGEKENLLYTDCKGKESVLRETYIFKLFSNIGGGIINESVSEENWENLQSAINEIYPQFTQRIRLLYPAITIQELKVCLLVKAKFSVKEISVTLQCSISAISKLRKRLYSKITGTDGSPKELDKVIADL